MDALRLRIVQDPAHFAGAANRQPDFGIGRARHRQEARGLDHFHVRDVVNGAAWKSGYTGTQLDHGERIDGRFKPQRADLVLYGTGYPGHHVAIVIGRRKADGKLMVVSHGSEGGPYFLPFDYRSDVMQLRRYI